MADLLDFTITPNGTTTRVVPLYTVSARVVDSATQQTVIADFTGNAAFNFTPFVAVGANATNSLTPTQQATLTRLIATWLVLLKAGLEPSVP